MRRRQKNNNNKGDGESTTSTNVQRKIRMAERSATPDHAVSFSKQTEAGLFTKPMTASPEGDAQAPFSSGFDHSFGCTPVQRSTMPTIQTQLTVNEPGDEYEQEADKMADTVMRMSDPLASPGNPDDWQAPHTNVTPIQAKGEGVSGVSPDTEQQISRMQAGGQSLPDSERGFFESRMGADFSNVKVHTDGNAIQTSRDLNARAFTNENHIAFNAGEYQPGTTEGRRLIAHELTHTLQQGGAISNIQAMPIIQRSPLDNPAGQLDASLFQGEDKAKANPGCGYELPQGTPMGTTMDYIPTQEMIDSVPWGNPLGDTADQVKHEALQKINASWVISNFHAIVTAGVESQHLYKKTWWGYPVLNSSAVDFTALVEADITSKSCRGVDGGTYTGTFVQTNEVAQVSEITNTLTGGISGTAKGLTGSLEGSVAGKSGITETDSNQQRHGFAHEKGMAQIVSDVDWKITEKQKHTNAVRSTYYTTNNIGTYKQTDAIVKYPVDTLNKDPDWTPPEQKKATRVAIEAELGAADKEGDFGQDIVCIYRGRGKIIRYTQNSDGEYEWSAWVSVGSAQGDIVTVIGQSDDIAPAPSGLESLYQYKDLYRAYDMELWYSSDSTLRRIQTPISDR